MANAATPRAAPMSLSIVGSSTALRTALTPDLLASGATTPAEETSTEAIEGGAGDEAAADNAWLELDTDPARGALSALEPSSLPADAPEPVGVPVLLVLMLPALDGLEEESCVDVTEGAEPEAGMVLRLPLARAAPSDGRCDSACCINRRNPLYQCSSSASVAAART